MHRPGLERNPYLKFLLLAVACLQLAGIKDPEDVRRVRTYRSPDTGVCEDPCGYRVAMVDPPFCQEGRIEARRFLAECYESYGCWDPAIQIYQQLAEEFSRSPELMPDWVHAQRSLGTCFFHAGMYEPAFDAWALSATSAV